MLKKSTLIFFLLLLLGCQKEAQEWNPIFEKTDFSYLNTDIERSLALLEEVNAEAGGPEVVGKKVGQVRRCLLALKDYYIPLTDIRQKIYDAERYFKLRQPQRTEKLLNDSKSILIALDSTTKNAVFDKVMLQLESMIESVIASLDDHSDQTTYDQMKILGEHVNLMLYKGDLVLSGIAFEK